MMSFNYNAFNLPITEVIPNIKENLAKHNTLILNAPPGAGKSTLLPLTLLDEDWLQGQKIIMLEPRRLAVKSIAQRLATLLGENVGERVGYRIRFETKVSKATQLEIVTEGILTRMLQSDNALEGVGIIIFDEFHERSIHADVALALSRESQQILRPELRILIMSATLNTPELSAMLEAPVIKSQGRQYPIEYIHTEATEVDLLSEMTAKTVQRALKEQEGDVLVFLPGQREIKKCAEQVRFKSNDVEVHELYGKLPFAKQQQAIKPSRSGKRKVVIATAIAETSLTIEGVKVVVDSGFSRVAKFDSKIGISALKTVRISKDSADQRAGRAGRLGPGVCYRMWTKGQETQMKSHRVPEILEADLMPLVLDLVNWGIHDFEELSWLDTPPKLAFFQAKSLLKDLNALEDGKITSHGKQMQRLPCHPRISHMLLSSEKLGISALATDLAAILEEKDPLVNAESVDVNLRIEALRRYRKNNNKSGSFAKIERIATQYRSLMKIKVENAPIDEFETGLLLAQAYPERIAFAKSGNNAVFQLANGKMAKLNYKDDLSSENWLAVAHMHSSEKFGRIFLASPLNPTDLKPFVKEVDINTWNSKWGGVISVRETRIGSIVLKSSPLKNPPKEEIVTAICKALIKEGEHLLNFDVGVSQWQNRIQLLRKMHPDEQWPDVSTSNLLMTNAEWLSPYLYDVKKTEDLKKIDLAHVLKNSLTHDQQIALDKLAPVGIEVPSGSYIKLDYQKNGSAPILSVRIQEVFGLEDTPTIINRSTKVLMHLLSPGFKPVQVTSDLKSFWSSTYFEVRKELRVRYKKHAWPEDPSKEPAIRGAKRRKQ